MKRLIAIITAVIMCGTYAAEAAVKKIVSPADWTVEYREPTEDEQKNLSGYIPSTDEMRNADLNEDDVHSGRYSMRAVNKREKAQNYTYVDIKLNDNSVFTDGQYKVSFYAKGSFDNTAVKAGFGYDEDPRKKKVTTFKRMTAEPADENGWVLYSAQLNYSLGDIFHFKITHGAEELYLDDVTITRDDETNVVSDGGFENVVTKEISVPKGDDYFMSNSMSPDYPRMVFVSNMGTKIGVSWQNAESSDITRVGIYKVTDSENELIDGTLNKNPGVWCSYLIKNVDEQNPGLYKIITTFADERTSEYIISPSTTFRKDPTSWSVNYNVGADKTVVYSPSVVAADENVSHSGEASMRVNFSTNLMSDVYAQIKQSVSLELGHKYRMTYWTRGEQSQTLITRYEWKDVSYLGTDKPDTYAWTFRSSDFLYDEPGRGESGNLFINIERPTYAHWVDDIEMYEIDEAGNKIGENLIQNGGFEADVTGEAPAAVKSIDGVGSDGKATLSWSGNSEAERINLYRLVKGKYVLIGQFDNSAKSNVTISGLENDKEETFAVTCLGANYLESEKTVCKVMTVAPDYRIGKAKINGGFRAGSNTINVKLDNNKLDGGFAAEVMAIVRKGLLITDIKNEKIMLAKGESAEPQLTVNIPDTENYSVTVYIWDDFKTMKKLSDSTVFKAE